MADENSFDNKVGKATNCMYEEQGERKIGVIGWLALIFFTIALPIIGIPLIIFALIWKAGGNANRYNREMQKQAKEDDYQAYKSRMQGKGGSR